MGLLKLPWLKYKKKKMIIFLAENAHGADSPCDSKATGAKLVAIGRTLANSCRHSLVCRTSNFSPETVLPKVQSRLFCGIFWWKTRIQFPLASIRCRLHFFSVARFEEPFGSLSVDSLKSLHDSTQLIPASITIFDFYRQINWWQVESLARKYKHSCICSILLHRSVFLLFVLNLQFVQW